MSVKLYFVLLLGGVFVTSCSQVKNENMESSSTNPFAKGSQVNNANFTGTVWLNYLVETDTAHNVNIGSVTFEPAARTNWHYHKGGQILLVTAGKGLYQEKGKPIEIIHKGQVVKCPADIEHWHGATATDTMTHIAIGTNTDIGGAVWLRPVTDEEYHTR
ncbi:cupin domain-containing protein [Sphingobacterium rhinopitheci]|uniref:cupin domain-containing protein n=1 Tax=Sphingobacterium rhinopitheci TaxID=2781960 RepID=UPI001F528215|nr:cupin domain-containing protein [Sphingobacterium rhinopitheci]